MTEANFDAVIKKLHQWHDNLEQFVTAYYISFQVELYKLKNNRKSNFKKIIKFLN